MHDEDLREQLADWVRPVTALPVPGLLVLRRRTRRRRMRRAATAVAVTAAVAAVVAGVTASQPGRPAPAQNHFDSPQSWLKAPGSWHPEAWRPAGPLPAADASPATAPYIVQVSESTEVRNVFTGQVIETITPPRGQTFMDVAAAGDDRTFILQAGIVGTKQETGGPVTTTVAIAYDELRLGPDGRLESLTVLGTVPTNVVAVGFAISPDASMLVYSTGPGFVTVSLPTSTGRRWPAVDGGVAGPDSLSWAGDRTLAFEWTPGDVPGASGQGLRLLNVAAPGNLLRASRLAVPYGRYCTAVECQDTVVVVTADGSKMLITRTIPHGSSSTSSVAEYSAATGRLLPSAAPPASSAGPGQVCEPLWSNPSGQQFVSYCGHPLKYDHGRATPITLHLVKFDKAFFPFGW